MALWRRPTLSELYTVALVCCVDTNKKQHFIQSHSHVSRHSQTGMNRILWPNNFIFSTSVSGRKWVPESLSVVHTELLFSDHALIISVWAVFISVCSIRPMTSFLIRRLMHSHRRTHAVYPRSHVYTQAVKDHSIFFSKVHTYTYLVVKHLDTSHWCDITTTHHGLTEGFFLRSALGIIPQCVCECVCLYYYSPADLLL